MTIVTDPREFIGLSSKFPVVDVRSPGEFSQGHIPGACSVPLFSDEERAKVGTTYKSLGRDPAISLGMKFVSPRTEQIVESVRALAPTPDVLVHCWRGGMRSEGVAQLLESNGFRPRTLQGGYKSYRREARRCFAEPRRIIVLTGLTGAGKTDFIEALHAKGEQVIDLEKLARHRGSAFGGIGQPLQPTVEQFENDLFDEWRDVDPHRLVWLEDESQAIGRVFLPEPFLAQMRNAPAIFLDVSRERRIEFLVQQYGQLPPSELALAIGKIKKRLGGDRLKAALESLEQDNLAKCVEIVLTYYDKAYLHAKENHPRGDVVMFPMSRAGQVELLPKLEELACQVAKQHSSVGS